MARRRACEMDYIDANPDNPLAGYCLTKIPIDSVLTYHERLADAARNSIFRPLLEPLLAKAGKYRLIRLAEAKIVAGSPAPDFTLKTADDKISPSRRFAESMSCSTFGAAGADGASKESRR